MQNFSYFQDLETEFNGRGRSRARTSAGGGGGSRPSSPKQQRLYLDLCSRKKIRPKNITNWSFQKLSDEIQQVQSMPDPASDAQITKMRELNEKIRQAGGKPYELDELIPTLTGGYEGTASELIQDMNDYLKQLNPVTDITDNQIKTILQMFLCPDVPFDLYGFQTRVYLDKLTSWSTDYNVPEDLDVRPWRRVTPQELTEQLKRKFNNHQASEFIQKYRTLVYQWRRTRITKGQRNYIRELEGQLSVLNPTSNGQPFTIQNGEIVQPTQDNRPSRQRKETHGAFVPMSDEDLMMLSFEEAGIYIDQLIAERDQRGGYQAWDESYEMMNLEDNRLHEKLLIEDISSPDGMVDNEFTQYRNERLITEFDARISEYNKMVNLMYVIRARVNYHDDDVFDMLKELFLENIEHDNYVSYRKKIKDYMWDSVTADKHKDFARWNEQVQELIQLANKSEYAMKLLFD